MGRADIHGVTCTATVTHNLPCSYLVVSSVSSTLSRLKSPVHSVLGLNHTQTPRATCLCPAMQSPAHLPAVPCGRTSHKMSHGQSLAYSLYHLYHPPCAPMDQPGPGCPVQRSASATRATIQEYVWLHLCGLSGTVHAVVPGHQKQSKSRRGERALFLVGRSSGSPASLPAPPLQQKDKTVAIFRFVSNSGPDPGVDAPRERTQGSNEQASQPAGQVLLSRQLACASAGGGGAPRFRQREQCCKQPTQVEGQRHTPVLLRTHQEPP